MAINKVRAAELVRGDIITLQDGRRVQLETDPAPSPKGRVVNVTLWEIGTDNPNFSFTLYTNTLYEAEDGF
jgi:hypothetical protein